MVEPLFLINSASTVYLVEEFSFVYVIVKSEGL